MTTYRRPVRAGVTVETEAREVGFIGGAVTATSPGAEITVGWDYGDHENALRVLTRLYMDARESILAAAYPDLTEGELRAIASEASRGLDGVAGVPGYDARDVQRIFAAVKRVKHSPTDDIPVLQDALAPTEPPC